MVREIIKILSRPFGRPHYKIIEFDLKRVIMRVPSIPLYFYLSITTLTLSTSLSDTISNMYIPSFRLDTFISNLS